MWNIKIVLFLWIFLYLLFSFLWSFGGDSTFPLVWGNLFSQENAFLYMWMDNVLWTTSILDKLRWILPSIFSQFEIFSLKLYLSILAALWSFWFYKLLSIEWGSKKIIRNEFIKILFSLIFVLNPVTIAHIPHTFIVQWYWIIPWIILFYYQYLIKEKLSISSLFGFLIFICLLGQPHNYYNAVILLIILNLHLLSRKIISISTIIKKSLIALLLATWVLSYIILPFIASLPNDLTSSTTWFTWSEPNMIWSSFQWPINTLVFKSSIFDSNILLLIFMGVFIYLIFDILLRSCNWVLLKKYYVITVSLMVLFSLSFIAKNPFFEDPELRQMIYKFIPHLRIDVTYIILAYIPLLLIFIYFLGRRNFIKIILLSVILSINILLLFNYSKKEAVIINEYSYENFISQIRTKINWITTDTILFYPNSVTYNIDGIEKPNYPWVLLNFENKKSIYHWNFLETSLNSTRIFLNTLTTPDIFLNAFITKTDTKYIFCFNDRFNCSDLGLNVSLHYMGQVNNLKIYKNLNFHDRFDRTINTFSKLNPTNYQFIKTINLKAELKFLQSFHPGWKLYLDPFTPIECGSGSTAYSGATDISTGLMWSGTVYWVARWDDLDRIVRAYSGLTWESLMAMNPHVDLGKLKVGMEILIKPPVSMTDSHPYNVIECPSKTTFYAGGELSKLWEKPIFDDTHKLVYDYANQWTIDSEYIKKNYPKEYYKENPDGTIDVHMTLYFKPQSYFYLGLIISGLTLFACLLYLLISSMKRRRHLTSHNL